MNNHHNQYAPLPGVPELRQQIAAKVLDLYGAEVDPDTQVTVTPGATVFTRIPRGASSTASDFVNAFTAPFDAA